jgi:hypothetical protein
VRISRMSRGSPSRLSSLSSLSSLTTAQYYLSRYPSPLSHFVRFRWARVPESCDHAPPLSLSLFSLSLQGTRCPACRHPALFGWTRAQVVRHASLRANNSEGQGRRRCQTSNDHTRVVLAVHSTLEAASETAFTRADQAAPRAPPDCRRTNWPMRRGRRWAPTTA